MDVFISWSGERSGAAAEALRDWLPKIINALKPWLSAADIDKGARWGTEIATKLKDSRAGIICLTPNNVHSEWILFEAGALSKTIENTYVCPFLIGLEPADVKPPLAQFQATRATKTDVLKLLKTLNNALGDTALAAGHIDEVFEVWWPKLESKLKTLPPDGDTPQSGRTERDMRDMVEEMLALVRDLNRQKEARRVGLGFESLQKVRQGSIRRAVRRVDRDATTISFQLYPSGTMCSILRGDGSNYDFMVPNDVSPDDVERSVESLVRDLTKSQ